MIFLLFFELVTFIIIIEKLQIDLFVYANINIISIRECLIINRYFLFSKLILTIVIINNAI